MWIARLLALCALVLGVTQIALAAEEAGAEELYGLQDVLKDPGGFVATGRVMRITDGTLQVEIEKVYTKSAKVTKMFAEAEPILVAHIIGAEGTKPPENDDGRRLWSRVPFSKVSVNDPVVVVPYSGSYEVFELMPADKGTYRKLEILFDPKKRAEYIKNALPIELIADLGDYDLYTIAYRLLDKAKKIDTKLILNTTRARNPVDLLGYHLKKLKPKERKKFLKEAAELTANDNEKIGVLLTALEERIKPDELPFLAKIAEGLDAKDESALEHLAHLKKTALKHLAHPKAKRYGKAFIGPIVHYAKYRPGYEHNDEDLATFAGLLSTADRATYIGGLLGILGNTSQADEGYDAFLLELVEKVVTEHPSDKYVVGLQAIDPLVSEDSTVRAELFSALVRMGSAIGAKHKAAKSKIGKLIDPYVRHGLEIDATLADAYKKASVTPRNPKNPDRVELAFGEAKMLPTGLRLAVEKSDGGARLRVAAQLDKGLTFNLGEELSYVEGKEGETTFSALLSDEGVDLQLSVAGDKMLDETRLIEIAKKAAHRKRCDRYRDHTLKTDEGILEYHARTSRDLNCAVVIGAYTGKVAKVDTPRGR